MLFDKINKQIEGFSGFVPNEERTAVLAPLIQYIQEKVDQNAPVSLNFICTHNSRRSHFAQIWAQAMAHHFKVHNVTCYSGGTEATALFPMVAETLINSGFEIQTSEEATNPKHKISFALGADKIIGFSKTFDDEFNPKEKFAAVMTCSHADENCPFVPGTEKRIATTYDDPKEYDHTPIQKEKYHERSMEIAKEMYYVFSKIKN